MGLPKQVQEAVEEANKIAEAMYGEPDQEQPSGEVVEDKAPEMDMESEAPEVEEIGEESEPETAEQAQVSEQEDENLLEHKYKTLQGMYNSEKRRNDEMSGRVQTLENMLAQMQQLRQAAEPESDAPQKPASLLSDEEIEDYGSDLIDVMKRAAREAVKDEIEELRAENAKLKSLAGDIGQKLEEDERDKVYTALDRQVPDWKDINQNPAFLDWLEQEDVYVGAPRKHLLNRAFMASDPKRVVQFFKGFLNETAAVNQGSAGETREEPRPRKGKVPLENLAAPGVGSSGSADKTSNQGRMWKESEIGAFYEDARKGKFKGREDAYRQTEQSIQAALTEGRILLGQ